MHAQRAAGQPQPPHAAGVACHTSGRGWTVLGGGRLGECSGRRGFGFGLGAAGWKMMITGECVRGVGLGCTSLLVVPVCGRFVMNEILGIDEY